MICRSLSTICRIAYMTKTDDDEGARLLGARVRALRAEQGLTQRSLAIGIGVTPSALSQLESGRIGLSARRARQIAQVLNVGVGELFADTATETDTAAGQVSRLTQDRPRDWRKFEPLAMDLVLEAAAAAFVEIGYHGATVREIARRAGLSVPALYHYHHSKQQMLVGVLGLTMTDLLWRAAAARDEAVDPPRRFANLVECLVLEHTYRRDLAFIGASEMRSLEGDNRQHIAGLRNTLQQMVDTEVAAAVTAGDFLVAHPHEAARAVVTMCTSIVSWYQPGGVLSPEHLAARYVTFASHLMRARDSAPRRRTDSY
jgi:AcrR family transcriptional regulator/DNA-binding XRE family transcriptional regulator